MIPHVPEQAAIDEAVKSVSYRNIDIEGNTVRLAGSGGGSRSRRSCKGLYRPDRITDLLEEKRVSSAVINLGKCCGPNQRRRIPWNIGIWPYSDRTEVIVR